MIPSAPPPAPSCLCLPAPLTLALARRSQVAFTSPANAAPYLYAVPPDLACFATLLKRFGVRPSFGPSDFCHALRRLAVESGAAEPVVTPSATSSSSSGGQSRVGGGSGGTRRGMLEGLAARGGVEEARKSGKRVGTPRQLTPAEVELAVAMVQVRSGTDGNMRLCACVSGVGEELSP